jgi:glutamate/tyrosine decarboxylase-like PLP-dependent enzyme
MESAGPTQVELEVLDWFKEWIGFPPEAAGSLVSGGSAGNLTALACARETLAGPMRDDLVLYVSDQAHSSIARAARLLGFRPEQVRVLPSDESFRLPPRTLAAAMDADEARGLTPFAVAAQAGATNTGAVDRLDELAALCRERKVWLHVDAAYGGFAALADPGLVRGLEQADSVTLDPHKWLYQPFECGCVLVRDGAALRAAFEMLPDYLHDARTAEGEVNFSDLGLQLTRSARALKIWVSLRYFGVDAFREAIRRSLTLAAAAVARVEASGTLELLAPPSLGVVCFRRSDLDEEANAGLAAALERSGAGLVSTTRLHGRFALRLCVLNHQSTEDDVERVLTFLESAEPEAREPERERHPPIVSSWPGLPKADVPSLRELPLFAGLEPDQAAHVAAQASLRQVEAGEAVIEQWSLGSEFFVILEGTAAVSVDEQPARELGEGDFFGELRALAWDGGYAYPRLASVRATSPLRLLVFPEGGLQELVERYPAVAAVIRAAVAERLS